MAAPLVSVCIPTRNHGRYVGEAVESALAQEGVDCEVLVHDDRGQVVVIETGPAELGVGEVETQRPDQVQLATGGGHQPDGIAGIGRNPGFQEGNPEHQRPASAGGTDLAALATPIGGAQDGRGIRQNGWPAGSA